MYLLLILVLVYSLIFRRASSKMTCQSEILLFYIYIYNDANKKKRDSKPASSSLSVSYTHLTLPTN